MSTMESSNYMAIKPVPPPHLNKETLGVWTGWCCIGDKEVAREAAAKGLHIDLVLVFLASRKKVKPDDAKEWFEKEVLQWVDELLARKQIFRACHIMKNIKLDVEAELSKVFYMTNDRDLREYIGKHLEKANKLDEKLKQLWNFLALITKNNILIAKYKLPEESIECLDKQDDVWKNEIAAKLFLRSRDPLLVPFLSAETLWKQLISYNDIKLLNAWINIRFDGNQDCHDLSDNLVKVFKSFTITNEMLNYLNSNETSPSTSAVVLNHFSKFGIFSDVDQNNFLNILVRLNKCDNIAYIYEILSKTTSNVGMETMLSLFVDYCVENKLYSVLNVAVKDFKITQLLQEKNCKYLCLIDDFRKLKQSYFSELALRDNILSVSRFLNENLTRFLSDNAIVLLALILFTKEVSIKDIFDNKSFNIQGTELYEAFANVIDSYKLLNNLYIKKLNRPISTLTYYDLVESHLNVDVKSLFSFRYNDTPMPHFNSKDIARKYGYSKEVNYIFYLKQTRPTFACRIFNQKLEENKKDVTDKVYKLAINNFNNPEVATSCVAFLEMIGINSDSLRVTLQAANLLCTSEDDVKRVQHMFLDPNFDPYEIQNALEVILTNNIDRNDVEDLTNEINFVNAVKRYDLVYKFSVHRNLKLPEMFLKLCAASNLWLPFLIYAQIKNYPPEQIKSALQSLKNPNLLEHIIHSVTHDIQIDDQNVLMKERDSRKYFLSKIGVRKSVDSPSQIGDSVYSSMTTSQSSIGSYGSSTGSDFLEIDIVNTKTTLLQTLIKCHNSTDPPRALLQACQLYRYPLLAVFATSYEPDSIITNWITWLGVSAELFPVFTNFEAIAVSSQSVTNLLNDVMKKQYPKTLLQSFQIFIPNNPLKHFIEFLVTCIDMDFDLNLLTGKLNIFVKNLERRRNSVLPDTDHEMNYLKNKLWLENTALHLLSTALRYNFHSTHNQLMFLDILSQLNVASYFVTIDVPNFGDLRKILSLISDSREQNLICDIELILDLVDCKSAVQNCIDKLVEDCHCDTALRIAKIENVQPNKIVIKQWQNHFHNRFQENYDNFWEKCNNDFLKRKLNAECVVEFYLDCLKKLSNSLERYQVLRLSYKWAKNHDLYEEHSLEKDMWLTYIQLEDTQRNYDHLNVEVHNFLYKDMMEKLVQVVEHDETLEKDDLQKLENILNETLNRSNFFLALKLERIFRCTSNDLEILKLCFSLAEGLMTPYQLNADQRLLLTKGANFRRLSHRRTFLSARFSSVSSASHSPVGSTYFNTSENNDAPLQDTLAVLHSLSEKLANGAEMAHQVFMTYRISVNIEIPYHLVVADSGDNMKLLKHALEEGCTNKLEVVRDFVTVYKWPKEQVADFVCEEIVNAAKHFVKSKSDIFTMWDLNVDQELSAVLPLLHDKCTLLGYKIYAYASALHKIQVTVHVESQVKISELALVIELLIVSHTCFTTDCNMEGITTILKKCQNVISHLLVLRSWKLIVRLLTGVGRYTEMNYVFQILRENDQFEFLLRKGSRKDNGLKVALLEYLKKYCPDNKELYKLVALHFTLFSEVAQLWEREAQGVVKNLIAISKLEMQNNKINPDIHPYVLFSNSDSTKICLKKAIENYTHATEFHLQGERVAKAMNSAKQAELLALQLSVLKGLPNNGTTNCLLELSGDQIQSLVMNELSFDQSYILMEAYNYQADWAALLFEQCIIRSNSNFLDHFLQHLALTETIVNDVSRKFLTANLNTANELRCMKQMLTHLPSVHVKYRLASELGFTDLIEELLNSGQLAYLKDTVWKKGYKS